MTVDKERPYSVFAGAGGKALSAVEGASSEACPLAPVAGAGEPSKYSISSFFSLPLLYLPFLFDWFIFI